MNTDFYPVDISPFIFLHPTDMTHDIFTHENDVTKEVPINVSEIRDLVLA